MSDKQEIKQTLTKSCPACGETFKYLNPTSPSWYCENDECRVVMFTDEERKGSQG